MALTTTTLNGAVALGVTSLRVTSGTGFGRGKYIRIDDEMFQQTADADAASTTIIPVIGGQNGTVCAAHATGANVTVGAGNEFAGTALATADSYPLAGRQRRVASMSATGTVTLPAPGTDLFLVLNGTSVIAATIPVPTKDMDGCMLLIAGNGAAAHTATFTGGLSGASTSYDVITVNATAPVVLGPFWAVNGLWQASVAVPMAGTVTNITATVA